MTHLELFTTGDGSHSLRHTGLNETYHSVHGARQESLHVFIREGLQFLFDNHHPAEISILEVGFGTGLNALLTLRWCAALPVKLYYTSVETEPLSADLWQRLNYGDEDPLPYLETLHRAPWNAREWIHPNFCLNKVHGSLQEASFGETFHLVYFDAFAPSKQPDLWTAQVLEKVARHMKKGGIFVTYCARGQVRRDLQAIGFDVETLAGPPGKKEMLRGLKK